MKKLLEYVVLVSLVLLSQTLYAQTEEEVNIKFGIGDYTAAVSGYNTLITIYSIQGRSTASLENRLLMQRNAKSC